MNVKKSSYLQIFWNVVSTLPVAIPVGLTVFGLVSVGLLLMGQFHSWLVFPLGLLLSVGAGYITAKHFLKSQRLGSIKEQRWCDLIVLLLAIVWVGFNMFYTSEHIYTDRDPAVYSTAGAWLVDHDNLRIDIPTIFGEENVNPTSAGFSVNDKEGDELYAQGMHLLPVFVGLVGRIFSEAYMLHINPVFGGTALLALYGFARLIVRPRWAVVATAGLATTLPLIYFSRDMYTEPLAATFTFGALSLLALAMKAKRFILWLLAGLVIGAGVLTRVDAYLSFSAFAAFLVIYLMLTDKKDRLYAIKSVLLLVLGVMIASAVAWLDLSELSYGYYADLRPRFFMQFIPLLAIIGFGAIAIILAWRTNLLSFIDTATRKWRMWALVAVLTVIVLVMISRPLWYVGHHGFDISLVRGLQEAAGMAVDGTRDYAEFTMQWIAWYVGIVMSILAVLGFILASARASKSKDLTIVAFLLVFTATAALFLNRPSITPDQIWATRRLLPVIFPSVLLFGAIALEWISQTKPKYILGARGPVVAAVLATLALVGSYNITAPFLYERTYSGQLDQMQKTCTSLPNDAAILWVGSAGRTMTVTSRAFCDVPAAGVDKFDDNLTAAARSARESGYTPVVAVLGDQAQLIPDDNVSQMTETSAIVYYDYNRYLTQIPDGMAPYDRSVLIGEVQNDGSITRIKVD